MRKIEILIVVVVLLLVAALTGCKDEAEARPMPIEVVEPNEPAILWDKSDDETLTSELDGTLLVKILEPDEPDELVTLDYFSTWPEYGTKIYFKD